MSTTTTNFGWTVPSDTDLVKDGAAAIRTALGGVDTSFVDLKGGTSGQVLTKASGTDLDYTWTDPQVGDITGVTAGTGISGGGTSGTVTVTNSMATAIDAKGDLIAGTGADAFARLAVGTNGQVLTADSTASTGLAWASSSSDLVRITSTTFTSSATINIDNCFSSTYDFYIIQFNGSTTSGGQYFNYKMRTGGTNNSSAAYSQVNVYSGYGSGTPATDGSSNATIGNISYFRTTDKTAFEIRLRNPFAAEYTYFDTPNPDPSYMGYFNGLHAVKTSYDGIAFSCAAGSMTGTINIYGYKKG